MAAALAVAVWTGPLIETFQDGDSNLLDIWDYSRSPTEPPIETEYAIEIAGRQFGVPAPWMGASDENAIGLAMAASPVPMIAVVVAAAILTAIASRRADTKVASLLVYVVGLVGVAVWAVTRIAGIPAPYLTRWCWAIGALLYVGVAWGVLRLVRPPAAAHGVVLTVVAAAVGVSLAATVSAVSLEVPEERNGRAAGALSEQIRDELDPSLEYSAEIIDPGGFGSVGTAVITDLQRRDWDVFVSPRLQHAFRPWRTRPAGLRPRLLVVTEPDRPGWAAPAGARLTAVAEAPSRDGRAIGYEAWLAPPGT
jgi:hypothetical protein